MRARRVLLRREPRGAALDASRGDGQRARVLRATALGEDGGRGPAQGVHPRRRVRQRRAPDESAREVLVLARRRRRSRRSVLRRRRPERGAVLRRGEPLAHRARGVPGGLGGVLSRHGARRRPPPPRLRGSARRPGGPRVLREAFTEARLQPRRAQVSPRRGRGRRLVRRPRAPREAAHGSHGRDRARVRARPARAAGVTRGRGRVDGRAPAVRRRRPPRQPRGRAQVLDQRSVAIHEAQGRRERW